MRTLERNDDDLQCLLLEMDQGYYKPFPKLPHCATHWGGEDNITGVLFLQARRGGAETDKKRGSKQEAQQDIAGHNRAQEIRRGGTARQLLDLE